MLQKKVYLRWNLIAGCLLIPIMLALLSVRTAQAHANLVRSDPEAGAVLAQAPSVVRLEFSEALDPGFSKARLTDSNLVVQVEGPGKIDPADNRVLILDLPALSNGSYNVIWQARSAVDGHITDGVVSFSIGSGLAGVSLLPEPGVADPTTARPSLVETLIRWLMYLAAAITVGSLLFGWLVWRPAYCTWETADPSNDRVALRCVRQLVRLGIASLFIFSVGMLFFQAWEASHGAFQISYLQALSSLLIPASGWVFWLRLVLLVGMAYLANRLSPPGGGSLTPWWIGVVLSFILLGTFSLQSHSAAGGSNIDILLDWVHITAMCAWLGGLLPLFLLLRQTEFPALLLVPKFSRLALMCVVVLAISGAASAYIQVGTVQALTSTVYGKALTVKSLLFTILFGLGAVNLLVLSPRLKTTGAKAVHWLRNSIRTELVIGCLILVAVGIMTGVSPALEALYARQRMGFIGVYKDRGLRMELWIAPDKVGENEIAVDIYGKPPGFQEGNRQVLLRFQPLEVDLGKTQAEALPGSSSRYTLKGSYLSIAGDWQVEVILRQAGANDIRHVFQVNVQPNPIASSLTNPIPATDSSIAAGSALYAENCLPCHGPQGKGDGPAGLAMRPPPADLTIHTAPGVHPDGQLFEWISNGYPNSAMPAFGERFSEEQRWDLVNFIRTFGRK